jgi:hypothetical protein
MRLSTLVLVVVVAVLVVLAFGSAVVAQNGNPSSAYGVNVHVPNSEAEQAHLDTMMTCGVDWIRIDFVWDWVEPSQNNFDWSEYDNVAEYVATRTRPINVYASVGSPPAWALSGAGAGRLSNVADLQDVVTRAVQRYAGIIDHWGAYNEPDFDTVWGGTRSQYINEIVKPFADAVHAASPDAKYCGPELSHLGSHYWFYWLKECIEQAGNKIDVVTHHTYGTGTTLRNRLNATTIFGTRPNWWALSSITNPSLREVLAYVNWTGPVWLTETGWQTGDVGLSGQYNEMTSFLNDWFTDYPGRTWISKAFIYEMQDDDAAGATYGLLYQNGSIKPNAGYDAYHNFITANPWPARYSVCDVEYSPDGGTFSNSVEVTLSSLTDQVEIHYTTDGTVPSLYSPLYTGPITISTTTTIKALAWKDGWDRSILTSATFVIN